MSAIDYFFEENLLPESLSDELLDGDNWAIASAFIAYAAGDAFGAAHEFVSDRPAKIESVLLGKPDWPFGGVSDDTTLSLLTIASLEGDDADRAAERYLELLKESQHSLRGLGPTTRAALGMSVKPEEVHLIGVSNGGMMRSALLGTVFTSEQSELRRIWVRKSVEITHAHPIAVDAALALSAAFSGAVSEGMRFKVPTPPDGWRPAADGISLDPDETYRAVLYVANRVKTVEDAFLLACQLGGDTDTVAALSGSLVAAIYREESGLFEIPWLMDVNWSEIPQMKVAIELLIRRRKEWAR